MYPRIAGYLLACLLLQRHIRANDRLYQRRIRDVVIEDDPLFVLGHWRKYVFIVRDPYEVVVSMLHMKRVFRHNMALQHFADDLPGTIAVLKAYVAVPALRESPPQVGPREVEGARAGGHLVFGNEGVQILDVHDGFERDHADPDLAGVRGDERLRGVRVVEWAPGCVVAGSGVVAADDEVRAAVVLPDDRVPERFARPRHAHRERQEREPGRARRIVGQHGLIAVHPRVVIDVARTRHADGRMDEEIGANSARSSAGVNRSDGKS